MSNLAMYVAGVPEGLRLTQLSEADVPDLVGLLFGMETHFFGRSETNAPEILGTLRAPELLGTRGTAGLWDGERLVGTGLAYDGLRHERGLFLDLFIHPAADSRVQLTISLLQAAERYGQTLDPPRNAQVKVESFGGDTDAEKALSDRGYEQHRTYLRMRLDFDGPVAAPTPLRDLEVRTMVEDDWPHLHEVVTSAFEDHYDSHPLPFELFRRDMQNETTDQAKWRLVFDGPECVGVCIGSNRFAAHKVGYVENLAVLREYRGQGLARHLLHDAFARDAREGFVATTLHCDATNPTGATQLYESAGMTRDQEYRAWRTPLLAGGRFAPAALD